MAPVTNMRYDHHYHHHQQQAGQLWMWPVSAGDLFAQQQLRCIPAILKPSSFFLVDFRKTATNSFHPSTLPFASYKQQITAGHNLERYISCVWGQASTNRELFPSSGFPNKDVSSVPEASKLNTLVEMFICSTFLFGCIRVHCSAALLLSFCVSLDQSWVVWGGGDVFLRPIS